MVLAFAGGTHNDGGGFVRVGMACLRYAFNFQPKYAERALNENRTKNVREGNGGGGLEWRSYI